MENDQLINDIFGDTGQGAAPTEGDQGNPAPDQEDTPDDGGQEQGEDQQQEQPEQEQLYAGKYKTVEELEAAYKEAERNFHSGRQEQVLLRQEFDAFKHQLTQQQEQPEQDLGQYREQLLERLYDEPDTVISELAEKIADKKLQEHLGPLMPAIQQQMMASQVQQFMAAVPDAQEYAPDMAAIVEANQDLMQQQNWLQQAYMQAKIARLEAKLNKGTKGASADAKKAAAMPSGARQEPAPPQTADEKLLAGIFGGGGGKRKMFDF